MMPASTLHRFDSKASFPFPLLVSGAQNVPYQRKCPTSDAPMTPTTKSPTDAPSQVPPRFPLRTKKSSAQFITMSTLASLAFAAESQGTDQCKSDLPPAPMPTAPSVCSGSGGAGCVLSATHLLARLSQRSGRVFAPAPTTSFLGTPRPRSISNSTPVAALLPSKGGLGGAAACQGRGRGGLAAALPSVSGAKPLAPSYSTAGGGAAASFILSPSPAATAEATASGPSYSMLVSVHAPAFSLAASPPPPLGARGALSLLQRQSSDATTVGGDESSLGRERSRSETFALLGRGLVVGGVAAEAAVTTSPPSKSQARGRQERRIRAKAKVNGSSSSSSRKGRKGNPNGKGSRKGKAQTPPRSSHRKAADTGTIAFRADRNRYYARLPTWISASRPPIPKNGFVSF